MGEDPGRSDRIVSVEAFKEKEKGIMIIGPQQEDIINKPDLEYSDFRNYSSRFPMKKLAWEITIFIPMAVPLT